MHFTVKSSCGQTTDQMISYFQSPDWPEASKERIICTLTVNLQPDVMQVKIDFLTMEVQRRPFHTDLCIYLFDIFD